MIHKAVIEVNEKGTVAAAATAVMMAGNAFVPPVKEVRFDHPFHFYIWDNENELVLFCGKVVEPSKFEEPERP